MRKARKVNGRLRLKIPVVIQKYQSLWISLLCLLLLVSCTSPVAPNVSTEGEPASYAVAIDLLGTNHEASIDIEGRLKASIEAASVDGTISLSIDNDTILLDEDEKPLQLIAAMVDISPPSPPEDADILGTVYYLEPKGATFDPPIRLTLSYDPAELEQGQKEGDVYIAGYEDGKWDMVRYKKVDVEQRIVVTRIDHLARYAVLIPRKQSKSVPVSPPDPTAISLEQALASGKPTLVEFGWGVCIPCKAMKPILEELAVEYKDELNVVIVEIDEYRDLTNQHRIMMIPTQIFFDSSGKEVTRHMGFWSKEEIIACLEKNGIE